MANNNPANNLSDDDRRRGGENSTGKFGSENGADPSKAGKMGAKAQPTEAKAEGGRNSHRTDSDNQ